MTARYMLPSVYACEVLGWENVLDIVLPGDGWQLTECQMQACMARILYICRVTGLWTWQAQLVIVLTSRLQNNKAGPIASASLPAESGHDPQRRPT